ncbi:thiamin pyrophosphokinase [Limnochorda pilosa]|uniref:Thiamin pyrophosphokinase n=1 Tax=Limnochorda pilosa TaxID=1555112 RepID=A0A0K2SMQ5_LIMPI|nr:thiamin pyrophosphokinase [Limnochorda pilosa]
MADVPVAEGIARVDRVTKHLVERLHPGEIAVVDHPDMDGLAAEALVRCRPAAVVNASSFLTGRFPAQGPWLLWEAGLPLLEEAGPDVLDAVREGDVLRVEGGTLRSATGWRGAAVPVSQASLEARWNQGQAHLDEELRKFIENTLQYALREQDAVLRPLAHPPLRTRLHGRHALVVVRGRGFRDDLRAIRPYLAEVRPVTLAVDGGADALLEEGITPDLIVGDFDSVSDRALTCGAELVVHAYADGRAPGLDRVLAAGRAAHVVPMVGTSEDLAMMLAHQEGAELIVAVGSHSNLIDFLEKGRSGMASTLLVRTKLGPRLVDARGVSRLYQARPRASYWVGLMAAALLPLLVVVLLAPPVREAVRLVWLQLRIWAGW